MFVPAPPKKAVGTPQNQMQIQFSFSLTDTFRFKIQCFPYIQFPCSYHIGAAHSSFSGMSRGEPFIRKALVRFALIFFLFISFLLKSCLSCNIPRIWGSLLDTTLSHSWQWTRLWTRPWTGAKQQRSVAKEKWILDPSKKEQNLMDQKEQLTAYIPATFPNSVPVEQGAYQASRKERQDMMQSFTSVNFKYNNTLAVSGYK